ncbi:MAG: hypothetical protein HY816_07110 [Candidatus Wallbacteria bacterium]|nr:hypothetical protein [Candidatus Wallbacteria bacterium]
MTGRAARDWAALLLPHAVLAAALLAVCWANMPAARPPRDAPAAAGASARAASSRDVICGMEVNPAWDAGIEHDGEIFRFCSDYCKKEFVKAPAAHAGERCLVCKSRVAAGNGFPATYLGTTHRLCSEAHRTEFQADPAAHFMHRMWGIPPWMYYVSIAAILLVSFLALERGEGRTAGGAGARLELTRLAPVRALLTSRPLRFVAQAIFVLAFAVILIAGLFGDQNPARNVAPLMTWTVWWGGLVLLIMYAGKAWCFVCPWDAIAGWMERGSLWRRTAAGGGLGMPWPRSLRNIWPATALFVGLTWIELGFGVTSRPWATAALGLLMLALAVGCAFLFDRKSFCRYGCLVGRVSGLYALFAPIEIRARDTGVCGTCTGRECVRGGKDAYGCPTFEYLATMKANTYCIQCTECLQSCPHGNVAVNARPWGADLAAPGRPRADEAYLALLMLAISGFHGLTMTPAWREVTGVIASLVSVGQTAAFSLGMAALMALPVALYASLVAVSRAMAAWVHPPAAEVRYRDYFIRYAYCVLPIALFYHLAHNLEHLLMEGPKVLVLLSDPLGRGWDLLGTGSWTVPPMVSLDVLWVLQVALVGIGHVYSLWAASRIAARLFENRRAARASQWPMLAGMIAFSIFSLWLLKQPMEMRTSVM